MILTNVIKIGVLRVVKKLEFFKQDFQTFPESVAFVSNKL